MQYAAFTVWVVEWKDCEELKPKPKEKCTFVNIDVEAKKHRTEWCAAAKNIGVWEMRKKEQKHGNARKM